MKYLILLTFVLLTGCVTYPVLRHQTKTHEDFFRDRANCEVKTQQAGYWAAYSFGPRAENKKDFYVDCMMGEGWYVHGS